MAKQLKKLKQERQECAGNLKSFIVVIFTVIITEHFALLTELKVEFHYHNRTLKTLSEF